MFVPANLRVIKGSDQKTTASKAEFLYLLIQLIGPIDKDRANIGSSRECIPVMTSPTHLTDSTIIFRSACDMTGGPLHFRIS